MRHLVNFGDSVHWGQGHRDGQKFARTVADALNLQLQMVAHSGAVIGVAADCTGATNGEVPFACPAILQQVRTYAGDPGLADVVLLTGGINDLDVRNIINPFVKPEEIRRRTRLHCHEHMAVLLAELASTFPSADTRIIVSSYFPIFSRESDLDALERYLVGNLVLVPQGPGLADIRLQILERAIENAQAFWTESTKALTAAVQDAGSPRIAFAFVPFTDRNAMFAPEPWLFDVHFRGLELVPEDPVAPQRKIACDAFHSRPWDRAACYIASAGHPNAVGSAAFAKTILSVLGS